MTFRLISVTKLLTAAAAAALLLSCGGGGGGGSGGGLPAPTLTLTSSNAQAMAGKATRATLELPEQAGNVPLWSGEPASPRAHALSRSLSQAIGLVGSHGSQRLVPLQAQPPVPCAISGSVTVDVVGNSASVVFNACSDFAGESVSGSFVFANLANTATGFSGSVVIDLTISFGGVSRHFTGAFNFAQSTVGNVTTTSLSGSDLALSDGADAEHVASFSLVITEDVSSGAETVTVAFHLVSTDLGGSVNITTPVPLQTTPGRLRPHAGVILITGASGSVVKVTILGDETGATPQLTIELDGDGDGVFDPPINKNWSDFSL